MMLISEVNGKMKNEYKSEQTLKASRITVPFNDPLVSTTYQLELVELTQVEMTPTPQILPPIDPKY